MEQLVQTLVEQNGEHGFDGYRVPGIVTTSCGDVLVCYEGRQTCGDRRTLLLRRSRDGGRTFGPRQVLAAPLGQELLHNPMLLACPDGRVLVFWCQDYSRLFMQVSYDNGHTFSPIRELTPAIDGFRSVWPVTLWAISPGHGIALQNGTLVVPLWLSRGENAHLPACFATLYSTDMGEHWLCSSVVPGGNGVGDPTEASVAQRRDGSLLATLRHEIPLVRRRAFCQGGPDQWQPAYAHPDLPDPVCAGALLSLHGGDLAFVNCAYGDEPALVRQRRGEAVRWSNDARQQLTVRLSRDEGTTWSQGVALTRQAGASDLAQSLDGNTVLCFHEQGWMDENCIFNRELVLTHLPLATLYC